MKPFQLELTTNYRIPPHLRVKYFKLAIKKGMKLLSWDIETSHMILRSFRIGYDVSINHKQIIAPTKIISIQYMDASDKKASYLVWDKVNKVGIGSNKFDDSKLLKEFNTNIMPKADISLTQNGDKFDFKVVNERAKALGIAPLDFIPSIDILKLSRVSTAAASHALDYRSKQHGLGGKIPMTMQDWADIEDNDVPAEKKMIPYGLKDTEDTLKTFWKELPYYKSIPKTIEGIVIDYIKGYGSRDPLTPRKVMCPMCRDAHRKASDVFNVKGAKYLCNNCNKSFTLGNVI